MGLFCDVALQHISSRHWRPWRCPWHNLSRPCDTRPLAATVGGMNRSPAEAAAAAAVPVEEGAVEADSVEEEAVEAVAPV
jgi:hypothetical protein